MKTTNRLIGSAIPRTEDLRFVRGAGEYVADVSRDGQVHAFILRSPVAHGRIKAWNIDRALQLPGVHAVLRASDLPQPLPTVDIRLQPMPSLLPFQQPVLAQDIVRYTGEPIAVILADTAALAEDTAAAIDVDIEALPAVTGIEASRSGTTLLFPQHGSNLAVKYTATLGDAGTRLSERAVSP